ncbi:MAG: hypothetical protein R2685_05000 [Candidatus Nitrosocosmicus sp.]|nr:hypothetical protein [Candidatus Nitrosocosmicus sp.]
MPENKLEEFRSGIEFLSELRLQYEREFTIKELHETKAGRMIATSSAVISVLLGIGSLLVLNILHSSVYFGYSLSLLVVGLVISIAAVGLFIYSQFGRNYLIVMGASNFLRRGTYDTEDGSYDANGISYNNEEINRYMTASSSLFLNHMVRMHLKAIDQNGQNNQKIAKLILLGQILFLFGVIAIGSILFMVILAINSGAFLPLLTNLS